MGDFEYTVAPWGNDELSKCCVALESLRQKAIEAMQLDLVRSLSEELQERNDSLESALDELRRTQDQVVSQQKLMELRDLTAAIAHELSNPLNFVRNFSESSIELIEDIRAELEKADSLDSGQRDELESLVADLHDGLNRMLAHSTRASRVVQDALQLGQQQSGQFVPVDFNEVVRTEAESARYNAQRDAGGLSLDLALDLDPGAGEVRGVPEDLARVVTHLANNSFDAIRLRASENGQHPFRPCVSVSTRRETRHGLPVVELRIYDNGVGIAPEDLSRIFNPFFTTKPTGHGTGLGLSLVHDIVREHGATIYVDSQPGEYTEFKVGIPVLN